MWDEKTDVAKSTQQTDQYKMQTAEREGQRTNGSEIKTYGYSAVGMNGERTKEAAETIRTYTQGLMNYIAEMEAAANHLNAYKGQTVGNAMNEYVGKVKEYVTNLCSDMDAFADKLDDVYDAWRKSLTNISDTITSDSGAFSTGTRYQSKGE